MPLDTSALASDVQKNCHISDALYARDYTLCIYLLKMREYYRWEKGYGFRDRLPHDDLGAWLSERERLWQGLEDATFEPVTVEGTPYSPFDTAPINERLTKQGLVYGGGLGAGTKPHFFLARLEEIKRRDGLEIYLAGEELSRDLTAPPAMSQGRTVFVRRESVRRMLWEKTEEWDWHRNENAMSRAMAYYDFEGDFEAALDAMTEAEVEAVLLHELGELQVGQELGPAWEETLASFGRSRAEFTLRAVRDHLADCISTLPALLDRGAHASLHFYFANLGGLRREIFPKLLQGYEAWVHGEGLNALEQAVELGQRHWRAMAEGLLSTAGEREREGVERMMADAIL